jgi:hypothetical protein
VVSVVTFVQDAFRLVVGSAEKTISADVGQSPKRPFHEFNSAIVKPFELGVNILSAAAVS